MTNPHPECQICDAWYVGMGQWQPMGAFLTRLRMADQTPCLCVPTLRHTVLIEHPHSVAGCYGFAEGDKHA